MNIGILYTLPSFISSLPQVLTCDTLPGAESISGVNIVCMESIITKLGLSSCAARSTFVILVSASIYRF